MLKPSADDPAPLEAPAPTQFYIPVTASLMERRPRTLKHGDMFGVFDHYGDVYGGTGSPEGLFYRDTRYLSDLHIFINDERPLLLSSVVRDNNALLAVDLTNPDLIKDGVRVLPRDTIHISRAKFLWNGAAHERFSVRNFDIKDHTFSIRINFGADFADVFDVRGHQRKEKGVMTTSRGENGFIFSYQGLDNLHRRTVVTFDPQPDRVDEHGAEFDLTVTPNGRESIFMAVSCEEQEDRAPVEPRNFFRYMRQSRRGLRETASDYATVDTSNEIFNEMLCRSMADLHMLMTETEHGAYPYAGIPWFSTTFGRDAIITAMETLWLNADVAKGVLQFLAATQATEVDPERDAEPGKILHEARKGELARIGEVPFAQYYGGVDTTPLFVLLAGLYFQQTGDLHTVSKLWPQIERALDWIDTYGDRDGDGFVEYQRAKDSGLANQSWKDSGDSMFHSDGSLVEGPITPSEVQGYVYAAKKLATRLAAAMGLPVKAEHLNAQAERLRENFEAQFWCEDIGMYALCLDGQKTAAKVRSSNAGQLLLSGIANPERAESIANQLMGPDFFSGWGIRTIGAAESRYNPMAYHNGSIWPHDNALIGLGFSRYGLQHHLQRLLSGLFDTATYMDQRRLPELFCGFRRTPGTGPTLYPVACAPQAWSSAAPFALLQGCFGLEILGAEGEARFTRPRLPHFLDEVTIRSLKVGSSSVDLLLRRYGSDVSVNILNQTGNAKVNVTL